jgi:hypothetical protein
MTTKSKEVVDVSREEAVKMIDDSAGRIVGVSFWKKDHTLRHLVGRKSVTKYLRGGVRTSSEKDFIILFDLQKMDYRNVNRSTVEEVHTKGRIYRVKRDN